MTIGDVALWTVFAAGVVAGMTGLAVLLVIGAALARRFDQ